VPKRTNHRQKVIELLRTFLANPGVTVTASKFLTDSVTGEEREVDIVAEAEVDDGEVFTQSFEVSGKKRPADLTLVEQLIKKHETLRTDRLYIVSWAGFTKTALRLAETHPDVRLVTVDGQGEGTLTLNAEKVVLRMGLAVCVIRTSWDPAYRLESQPGLSMYRADHETKVHLGDIVMGILQHRDVLTWFRDEIRNHPQREELTAFHATQEFDPPEWFTHFGSPDDGWDVVEEWHPVLAIVMLGDLDFEGRPLEMEVRTFMDQRFAHAASDFMGDGGVHVVMLDEESNVQGVGAMPGKEWGILRPHSAEAAFLSEADPRDEGQE
jgi:hypothetical protein